MLEALERHFTHLIAFAAITLKERLAFAGWFWSDLLGQLVVMVIGVFFWRAIYAAQPGLGGLQTEQAVAYVLVTGAVGLVLSWSLIPEFGSMLREGSIATELLRPVDFQLRMYAFMGSWMMVTMAIHLVLLGGVATLFLGLRLPLDPRTWLWFIVSLVTGNAVLFFFDWTLSLVAFYSTEVRGLLIMRDAVVSLFSGLLVPLAVMPGWMAQVAAVLPFRQVLDTPVRILTGLMPLSEAPGAVAEQLCWLAGLALISGPPLPWPCAG